MEPPGREWITSVVLEHEGRLIRYARLLTGDADKAREAVQETFLSLCRERRERIADHLLPWLFRVCRYRALDVLRKEGRMVPFDEVIPRSGRAEPPFIDPSLSLERRQAVRKALEALSGLSQRQQEAIRLRFGEGLSYKEIATVTQLSVSHVGVLIHEGIKKLRRQMVEAQPEPAKGGE